MKICNYVSLTRVTSSDTFPRIIVENVLYYDDACDVERVVFVLCRAICYVLIVLLRDFESKPNNNVANLQVI